MANFEFIDLVDNTSPYPSLLGLDSAFDNQNIINSKTRNMIFNSGEYIFIALLYPLEGGRYVEPIDNILTKDVNQLYKTITHEEYYINPTAYGMLSWRNISYFSSDSDMGLENW
jgi:hypothetical protein